MLYMPLSTACLGAAASWRGVKDPSLEGAAAMGMKRDFNKSREGKKREEFAGMGGMNRSR